MICQTQEQEVAIAEQRRLFYVAITRCTDILVLSSFANIEYGLAKNMGAQVKSGGYMGRTIASRFIKDLGRMAPPTRRDWNGRVRAIPIQC